MILGTGIDLLDKKRIEKIFYKFNKKVIKRFLSNQEIDIYNNFSGDLKKINFIAKRFSAKESMVKAIGIGIGRGLKRENITILNDKYGKPFVKLDETSEKFISDFYKIKINNLKIDISMTDEKNLISTIIIISIKNE